MTDASLAHAIAENWIAQRLGNPALFEGDTDPAERKRRVRETIIRLRLEHVGAGKRNGKSETWGQLFRRVYHEPLIPPTKSENDDDKRRTG